MRRIFLCSSLLSLLVCMGAKAPDDGLPLAGHHDSGVGYCVSVPEIGFIVNVPYHILDPGKRLAHELPADRESIEKEFRASVANAVALAGRNSGRQDIVEAAKSIRFPDLADPDSGQTTVCSCATSSCYGSAPGSGCVPTGCGGGCNDCESCSVRPGKRMNGQ